MYPNVSEKQKYKLLFSSNIFLHLASYEPLFPVIGILEGLSCGLPIVTYNMEAIDFAPDTYQCISIIKNGDYNATAGAVHDLTFLSNAEYKKLQNQGVRYAKRFNWESISKIEWNIINIL
jgi:glycosyltransferase involved in cell wall biosynthesis